VLRRAAYYPSACLRIAQIIDKLFSPLKRQGLNEAEMLAPMARRAQKLSIFVPDRMIRRLLVADHCRAGEPTHFDVPHRRLTEEALVLAVELTRTLIADFERHTRGIEPFNEHSFSRGN
jgi:hypothetical protein